DGAPHFKAPLVRYQVTPIPRTRVYHRQTADEQGSFAISLQIYSEPIVPNAVDIYGHLVAAAPPGGDLTERGGPDPGLLASRLRQRRPERVGAVRDAFGVKLDGKQFAPRVGRSQNCQPCVGLGLFVEVETVHHDLVIRQGDGYADEAMSIVGSDHYLRSIEPP